MFNFRTIDNFLPNRFEKIGTLKGKRWYTDMEALKFGLFKPQRQEYGDKKVFCANHYGEFIGYLLAKDVLIPTCEVELAHLNKYYPNIYKEKYGGTPIEKDGCIIYSLLAPGETLEPGMLTIDKSIESCPDAFAELTKNEKNSNRNDNIEVVLKAIEIRIRDFYKEDSTITEAEINEKIQYNKNKAIQMMVYDCLNGNNDRHDENWSMVISRDSINLYPLYDNERILGLHENQRKIEEALVKNAVPQSSEIGLFSRMRIPGEKKQYSTYKDVLTYLIYKYPEETKKALQEQLNINTPEKVESYLTNCEGLPKCYIEYGKTMYQSRYDYAKELLEKNLTYEDVVESEER